MEAAEHVLAARCPQVALFIDVDLHVTIDSCDQHVRSDVELASVDQQRVMDILLHNTGSPSICC